MRVCLLLIPALLGGCLTNVPSFCRTEVARPAAVADLPFAEDEQVELHLVAAAPDGGGLMIFEVDVLDDDIVGVRYEADGTIRWTERLGSAYRLGGPMPTAAWGPGGWVVSWSTEFDDDHPLILVDDGIGSFIEVTTVPALGGTANHVWTGDHFLQIVTSDGSHAEASTWSSALAPEDPPRQREGRGFTWVHGSIVSEHGTVVRTSAGGLLWLTDAGDTAASLAPGDLRDRDDVDLVATEDGWVVAYRSTEDWWRGGSGWNGGAVNVERLDPDRERVRAAEPVPLEEHNSWPTAIRLVPDGSAVVFTNDEDEVEAFAMSTGRIYEPAGCRSFAPGVGRILGVDREGDTLTALLLSAGQILRWDAPLETD